MVAFLPFKALDLLKLQKDTVHLRDWVHTVCSHSHTVVNLCM